MNKTSPLHFAPSLLNDSEISIIDAVNLYDTPLFLYDYNIIKANWEYLQSILPDGTTIYYSVKANPNISIIKIFNDLGACFEIASLGELLALKKNNITSDKILFIGPGKKDEELTYDSQLTVVIESKNEIERLNLISSNVRRTVLLRINSKQTQGLLSMGGNTQFGMSYKEASDILENRENWANIQIKGIQGYLGTGILDRKQIIENASSIIECTSNLELKHNCLFEIIDIGGGFGIPYFDGDKMENWACLKSEMEHVFKILPHHKKRKYAVESGRFLIGSSGIFITKVLDVKKKNNSIFVIVDGGINNLHYDNNYGFRIPPFKVLSNNKEYATFSICGSLCTPVDKFAHEAYDILPSIGDFILFYLTGAYGLTAAQNLFLSHDIPPEILNKDNKFHLIRNRITPAQFIEHQILIK
ncbi:alanine racemase [Bacteroides sp. 519]|uniref:alanine racemase n=1 Tax=Bacteroides sp. 519 TaxID=2302937 RepID=UPI0013CF9511|nr:alanine racemase [Bacteroides sp. 519]NDV57970.1 hypothetical protein [Bacteroides sp. 519]